MKKVISVATTAAMTLSMLSVPAMICSAEETASSVSVVLQDQTIEKGLTSFTVPVSLTKDMTLKSAELKLSTEAYPGGRYIAKIDSVKSEVEGLTVTEKDGTVTVSGSAAVKKGQTVFSLTIKLQDANGNMASAIPDNSNFKLSVDSAKIGDVTLTDAEKEAASAFLFVSAAEKTKGCSFVLDSVNTVAKTVKVPVTVNGSYGAFSTRFRVSNGAVISSVEVVKFEGDDKKYQVETSEDNMGIVYAPLTAEADTAFENKVVAYVNVTLPADAVSGQSFKVTTKYFDAHSFADKAINPEKIENSDIIYVMKGDANLNNELEQLDATQILKEILGREVIGKSTLPELYTEVAGEIEEVKNTIDTCGIDKLVAAGYNAMRIDDGDDVNGVDATFLLKHLLNNSVTGSNQTLDEYLAKEASK